MLELYLEQQLDLLNVKTTLRTNTLNKIYLTSKYILIECIYKLITK